MKDILQISLGAIIALLGTYLNNRATLRIANKHEINQNKRVIAEINSKKEADQTNFQHQIILKNRESIPIAAQKILESLTNLYNTTEKLVANYPGAPRIKPNLLFTDTITHLNNGFPNSLFALDELTSKWNTTYLQFTKVTASNSLFMSEDIKTTLNTFGKKAHSIKTFFYGYYAEIDTEEKFKKEEKKFNSIPFTEFLSKKGRGEPTHIVLSEYDDLTKLEKTLQTIITKYTQKTTNLGKTN